MQKLTKGEWNCDGREGDDRQAVVQNVFAMAGVVVCLANLALLNFLSGRETYRSLGKLLPETSTQVDLCNPRALLPQPQWGVAQLPILMNSERKLYF